MEQKLQELWLAHLDNFVHLSSLNGMMGGYKDGVVDSFVDTE